MESLFTFLFKYRPILFREGDFTFAASVPVAIALLVGSVIAAVSLYTYIQPRAKAGRSDRMVMGGIRLAILGVLLFCLFRPTLVLTSVVPQRNFVGVLIDDSRSMTLPDEDGEPRAAWVEEAFGVEDGELLEQLRERFAVRLFRFSSRANRVESTAELAYDGTRTDLPTALDLAREELSSVPLSGLVVVTDGADNGGRTMAEALVPLQAASVPVYAVGLGEDAIEPDIQIGRVEAPRRVLQGTALQVDVVVSHRGYAGQTVPLRVEDDTRILAEEMIELGGPDEPTVTPVSFVLEDAGHRRIRFRVPPQDGEQVERNNERDLLIDVAEEVEKILYFQGQPHPEVKFLRRAVADDDNLQVVVLQRTADEKYLRLSLSDSLELRGGFPKTRAELFAYHGLILGSIEASFFTKDQLDMIHDFVSRRGGGLLATGGSLSFSEGGYAGTPVEDVLPVVLEGDAMDARMNFTPIIVSPTSAGEDHPAVQIRPGADADSVWAALPALSTVNVVTEAKPAATVLLEGETESGEKRVVLAHHRFGRGKALALPVSDTWRWQMHASVPLEDESHENLWKQLLRWVVDGVPNHVDVRTNLERAEVGESVRVTAEVSDSAYLEINDAVVTATVRGPDGSEERIQLDWTVEQDGVYDGSFIPEVEGEYEVEVDALDDENLVGIGTTWVRVGPSDDEYFDASQRRGLLERISEDTGGRYYSKETVSSLPEDLGITGGGVTLTEERDLWDMPILLILLVSLIGVEWGFRRTRGLV